MHHSYIISGIVDGAVVHKQAQGRLLDKYNPDETVVHEHRTGEYCNDNCVVYGFPKMDCPKCDGYGRIKSETKGLGLGRKVKSLDEKCPDCDGTGEVLDPDRSPSDLIKEAEEKAAADAKAKAQVKELPEGQEPPKGVVE